MKKQELSRTFVDFVTSSVFLGHGILTIAVILSILFLNPNSSSFMFSIKTVVIFGTVALVAFAAALELTINKTVYVGCSLAGFLTCVIIVGITTHGTVHVPTASNILALLRYLYGIYSLALWLVILAFLISKASLHKRY